MVKLHLKSLNTPKTWDVKRKETTFVTRPSPGAHSFNLGYSINHLMRNELSLTSTKKETQHVLNEKGVLVNGKSVNDYHYIVGFMDVISLPKIKKYYRITIDNKGKVKPIEIKEQEAGIKLSRVIGKTIMKGKKLQVNTMDAKNILVKEFNCNTSDSLVIELPSQKIKSVLAFEKGSMIMLIGGKHIGVAGTIEKIENDTIFFKGDDEKSYETLKKYAYVIGKNKPEVSVMVKE